MATVPLHFSLTIVDGLGTEASTLAYGSYADTTTLADLATDLAAYVAAVDAVIDGAIVANKIVVTPAITGTHKAPSGGTFQASRVEQTGVFNFTNTANRRKYGQAVPSVRSDLISTGKIDVGDAAVAALIALLTSGAFTNAAQQVLNHCVDALISFRKRRRQLQRTSFEIVTG